MALLLNIDTATEQAGVCLSNGEQILAIRETTDQKNHASFIQPAIQRVMADAGYKLQDIGAIAITAGPGSYTGLRVGLSTAKGLCYALNKPLIMISTLEVMAFASVIENQKNTVGENDHSLFCPMIDARRMEVFTAIYDPKLNIVMAPTAMILDETSFFDVLKNNRVVFSGSGSTKANIIKHPNAVFATKSYNACHLSVLANKAFGAGLFADLAYSEPFYLKEFYKHVKKN